MSQIITFLRFNYEREGENLLSSLKNLFGLYPEDNEGRTENSYDPITDSGWFTPMEDEIKIAPIDAHLGNIFEWLRENPSPFKELYGSHGIWVATTEILDWIEAAIRAHLWFTTTYSASEIDNAFAKLKEAQAQDSLVFYVA